MGREGQGREKGWGREGVGEREREGMGIKGREVGGVILCIYGNQKSDTVAMECISSNNPIYTMLRGGSSVHKWYRCNKTRTMSAHMRKASILSGYHSTLQPL